jgi:linoleoyl-CoA desaturase
MVPVISSQSEGAQPSGALADGPSRPSAVEPHRYPRFPHAGELYAELKRRAAAYFQATGRRERDCPQMYLKTAIILAWLAAAYVLLVFVVGAWWQALPVAVALALAMAAVGFSIQHDGGHQSYSKHRWVNKLAALTLDLIGVSSYLWYWKHAVYHHTYANITGQDTDIDVGRLARLSPHQERRTFHRWQHLYLWVLYALMGFRWHLYADFREVIDGAIGPHRVGRPKGWDLVAFLGGKVVSLSLIFVLPMLWHPVWVVLLFYALVVGVLGLVLAVVFQLAHCVEEAEFPMPRAEDLRMEHTWAVHQVQTTVDFARKSWVLTWLLGGLNFQIEHHLFPRVCHVNYPALSVIVEATCKEFGVRYSANRTFWGGLASHYRWLRRMGRPEAT